jgi:putative acetyltransferase
VTAHQYTIIEDDLSGPAIRALLEEHFAGMLANSPQGACHFLDFDALRGPGVTFWSAWDGDALAACGAMRELDGGHGEVKSMRTAQPYLGKGAGYAMLAHIVATARGRGYARVSLETGSGAAFDASHRLYERFGFAHCASFGDYVGKETPFNRYFTMEL